MGKFWDAKDLGTLEFWRAVIGEALATFLFVFIICASALPWVSNVTNEAKIIQIAMTGGIAIATLVQCFGDSTGGHINPAVTIGMLFTFKTGIFRAVLYIGAQCAGAIGGAALISVITPAAKRGGLGVTTPAVEISDVQAFSMEFMLTFILVFTVFATTDTKRNISGSQPLAIGLSVLVDHLIGISYTGASMNPARTLGPAVIMGVYDSFWVYWVGPLGAGVVAGWLYVFTFGRQLPTSKSKKYEQEPDKRRTIIVRDLEQQGSTNQAYEDVDTQTPGTTNDDSYTTPL
ncbi:aquaporin AQPAn.G-like [Glandiceps talaboti]